MDATLVRVADSLDARKPHPLWGVVQAAIWITTQQLALVEMVRPHQPIRASSITEADLDLVRVLKEQPHLLPGQEPPLLGNAVLELWRACAEGKIVMSGYERNVDVPVDVPISAWAGVTIIDDRREGIIAASDGWQRPGVAWWGGLTLKREDVLGLWHSDKNEQSSAQKELGEVEKKAAPASENKAEGAASLKTSPRSLRHTGKASQAEHQKWYLVYLAELLGRKTQSNILEDRYAARLPPPKGLGARSDREKVRIAREKNAPNEWKTSGVRRGKST